MLTTRQLVIACLVGCLPAQAVAEPPAERQRELTHLIRHDCGSCHGLTLKGGLGPALTAAALRDRAPDYLSTVILDGRSGTAMPPWRGLLSEQEVAWIVRVLRRGVVEDAR